jgi:hypothetical protein
LVSVQLASGDERQAALARQISALVAQGRRVEVQSPFDAVLARGRLIEFRERVSVDEWGNPLVEKLPLERERLIMVIGAALIVLAFIIYAITTS